MSFYTTMVYGQHKVALPLRGGSGAQHGCEQSYYYSDVSAAIAEREKWEDNLPISLERAYNPHQFLATRSWKKYWNQWLKLLKKGRKFKFEYLKYSAHDKVSKNLLENSNHLNRNIQSCVCIQLFKDSSVISAPFSLFLFLSISTL